MPVLFALGIGLGLSPAMFAWAERIVDEPGTRYAVAFPPLCALAIWRGVPAPAARWEGLLWLGAAALVQAAAILSGTGKAAALALPLGVVGFVRITGAASDVAAALAALLVPIPHAVAETVGLQDAWRQAALRVWGPATGALQLSAWDGGVTLAALFAGLAWYASARRGAGWLAAFGRSAFWGAVALPVQFAAVLMAGGLARAGEPALARAFLTTLWAPLALLAVLGIERNRLRELAGRA